MKFMILLAQGFEEIEAVVLIDLLRRADHEVFLVTVNHSKEINGAHNIKIFAEYRLDEISLNEIHGLILPGGVPGVPNLASDQKILNLINKFYIEEKYLAAICAAPYVLEKAGVLKGKRITCFPSWKEMITSAQHEDSDVVVDGRIITGRGIGAAIQMGLKMVEIFSSHEESEKLREKIVFQV